MGYKLSFRKPEKARIGEILVQKNLISVVELEKALAEQRVSGKKLGQILIDKKLISQSQLQRALREQYWRNLSAGFLFSITALHPAAAIADTASIGFNGYLVGGCGVSLTAGNPSLSNSVNGNNKDSSVNIHCTAGGSTLVDTTVKANTYTKSVSNVNEGTVTTIKTVYSNLENGLVTIVP